MSIYSYIDYREYLIQELKKRKKEGLGFTQERLAHAAGIRSTYLTNVLKGRGNFNSDQIFSIAGSLKLDGRETDYLFLLKEFDQTTSSTRKQTLRTEIERIQEAARRTENFISAQVRRDEHELIMRYYGDPIIKIVHVSLQISRYAQNYQFLAEDLNIKKSYLRQVMETLVDLKIIDLRENRVEILQKNFHLPKESPMLLPHQILMRQKSGQRLREIFNEKRYSFSVTFSATEQTRQMIQHNFMEFLKDTESLVKSSDGDNVYQINFDLFPWND